MKNVLKNRDEEAKRENEKCLKEQSEFFLQERRLKEETDEITPKTVETLAGKSDQQRLIEKFKQKTIKIVLRPLTQKEIDQHLRKKEPQTFRMTLRSRKH